MIYLDAAATSFQKPECVYQQVQETMYACANPGRSGHTPALQAGRMVYAVREKVSRFFHVGDPDRVIFTSNATDSLNLAIYGMVKPGGHIVTTSMEHNSVLRPLHALEARGVSHTVVWGDPSSGAVTAEQIDAALRPETSLVVCTHASNVTGTRMPIGEIGAVCRSKGIPFLVDASQSAGAYALDMEAMHIDLLACPGHKGLLALPGTGLLCLGPGIVPEPLKQGGTGSFSELPAQPNLLPDRYESGTLNTLGIASLGAGLDYLNQRGLDAVRQHEEQLCAQLLDGLSALPGVTIYGPKDPAKQAAVLSFQLAGLDCSETALRLDREYGVCVRSGLHCAPLAHKTMGSFPAGSVRISAGPFNAPDEIAAALDAVRALAKG
ncbi:aminotransferase class V-fold PLP-dependent enzyme [Pseudoflavonifractor sp. 524-17]|uniref:aminotransferase class V-fold PLP-dependent enzyme n=1 Tax=Pseudoflavonifractor sp. 524-17 TaxID=2304577 RepID=UPI00137A11F3|nr:aminotransferase class V-fold PLP-dependent enzyme [Pseudoflavonifractor sp. 524-17]NCE63270.1 aminotransferase class V-fold PLP-dependent enzyme [Pseudoflavonifractor sp. 524-17]